jgi:hypothetical protein
MIVCISWNNKKCFWYYWCTVQIGILYYEHFRGTAAVCTHLPNCTASNPRWHQTFLHCHCHVCSIVCDHFSLAAADFVQMLWYYSHMCYLFCTFTNLPINIYLILWKPRDFFFFLNSEIYCSEKYNYIPEGLQNCSFVQPIYKRIYTTDHE